MKKYLITLFAFCFVQFSFCQSVKSIRVNNATLGHSWSYDISEIDSITYDTFTKVQKIYVNGGCKDYILENVDSVSFSPDEAVNIVFSNNYIEDVKSYIFSNGIILAEKEDGVHGKIIIVDSLDITQSQWSVSKSVMIYCDSTYKPLIAKDSQFIFYFNYDDNGKMIEINVTDLEGNIVSPINANVRKNASRGSTEGWTTGDDIGAALDLYGSINTMYNPTPGNLGTTVASWLAKLLPSGIPQDLGALLPSLYEALQGGKAGLLGSILGYEKLIQDIGENRAKSLIGDCTPYIKSCYKQGDNSAIINVQIAGVTATSQDIPYYVIKYWQEVNGNRTNVRYYTTPQKATNGTHPITINNLNGGRYGFQVLIFPSLCLGHHNMINLYNFRSNIAYVDIPRLHIKVLEQDYTTYADGNVKVSMKAVLGFPSEQDETILSYYDSYGLYFYYDDNVNQSREDFISVKENGGNEFYVTFEIPREDFLCDYNNFTATCLNRIIFKAYSIDGWGIKEFYDEQEPRIVYNEKPSLTFTSVNRGNVSSQPIYDDGGNYVTTYYSAPYWFDFDVKGAFWIDHVQYTVYSEGWTYGGGNPLIVYDGSYSYESSMGYYADSNMEGSDFYVITLTNGATIRSNNSLLFGGTQSSPTITLGVTPSFSRQQHTDIYQNSTSKRMNIRKGIGIIQR